MFRTLLLAAALGAMALPAAAGTSVTVDISRPRRQCHPHRDRPRRPGRVSSHGELSGETSLVVFYNRPECLNDAIGRAEGEPASGYGKRYGDEPSPRRQPLDQPLVLDRSPPRGSAPALASRPEVRT